MIKVTLIALPGALGSTLSIPIEMLKAASDVVQARHIEAPSLELHIASHNRLPVELMGGISIIPDSALEEINHSDVVFVPGFWGNPRAALRRNKQVVEWLSQTKPPLVCALTTGTYFLAEAGLLDGKEATTHWRFFNDFAARYPQIKLQRRRFITRSSNHYCTGSVDAVRDVMLHLVSELFDHSIATEIARQFTHDAGPSAQSEFLSEQPEHTHHDELIASIQNWMHSHYAQELDLTQLAKDSRISTRSLTRRFKQATGSTPAIYLRGIRLEEAKALLRSSDASIVEICGLVGYHDTSYFIELFKRHTNTTPGGYRKLVRAKIFSANENNSK